jgi:hypothetical protein
VPVEPMELVDRGPNCRMGIRHSSCASCELPDAWQQLGPVDRIADKRMSAHQRQRLIEIPGGILATTPTHAAILAKQLAGYLLAYRGQMAPIVAGQSSKTWSPTRCSTAPPTPSRSDTGSVRSDLRLLLREIAGYIDTAPSRSMIRALVSDAARSAVIGDVVSRVWTTRFHLGEEVVVRGIARGELRDDLPPGTLLSTFTGPLYVRLLITDERMDDEFLEAVIDIGLDGTCRSPTKRQSA